MARQEDYPDHTTHRIRSVLPPKLQTDIVELSKAIHEDKDISTHLSSFVLGIRELPAEVIVRAATEIRDVGDLYTRSDAGKRFWAFIPTAGYYATPKAELRILAKYPPLAQLYIFHPDGLLREAALKCLDEPPDNPFAFVAIIYRLNDWAEQVRDAACDCANRLFQQVSASTVAETSFFLFTQIRHWGRWGVSERHVLETTLYRRDVMQAFADLLMHRHSGRVGMILRHALCHPGLDDALPRLAHEADSPHVRAIAYETLILRRAQWQVGHQYEWIDKRFGLRRRVPRFDLRPLDHQLDIEKLIAEAAQDRAVTVRKIATRGLIDLRYELSSEMINVGKLLSTDEATSVRLRAEFYLNNLPDN